MLCLRLRMRRMCSLGMGLLGLLRVGCLSMCCVGSRHLAIGPVRSRYILHVHLTILRHHLVNHLCLAGLKLKSLEKAVLARRAKPIPKSYIPKKVFNTTQPVVLMVLYGAHVSPPVVWQSQLQRSNIPVQIINPWRILYVHRTSFSIILSFYTSNDQNHK